MEYKGKKLYHGDVHDGDRYRQEYADSITRLIEKKANEAYKIREDFMPPEKLIQNADHYRNEYLKMIGYPFDLDSDKAPKCETEYVGEDDMCKLYRLSIEVFEDFRFYGVLMIPNGLSGKASLVIAQHGGGGTPETCSDMYNDNNYNYFTKRALERGFVVFAPSLMLWTFGVDTGEKFVRFNVPSDRHGNDKKLKQLGYSMTGLEVLCIKRSIDYLVTLDCVNGEKIGMMGLSYGGYFSLHTAAADTRIISAYDAGSFNDRSKTAFFDWGYTGASHKFHDAEVAALVAPRRLRIDVGKEDSVFDYRTSEPEAERITKYFEAYGVPENYSYDLHAGGHRFDENLEGFEYFFAPLE